MTTFGGQTIPPLFGGASDAIFLRGLGAVFQTDNGDGHATTDIEQPAIVVGDQLYVFATGVGSVPSSGAGWASLLPSFGGSLVVWERVATGDANDIFTVQAGFTGMSNCQMASFGNVNGLGLENDDTGILTSDFANDWNISGLPAVGSNDTLVMAFFMRTRANAQVGVTGTDNTGLLLLDEFSRSAGTRTIWAGWSMRFDKTPASTPSIEQSYTPDPVTATQLLRYFRFISTP